MWNKRLTEMTKSDRDRVTQYRADGLSQKAIATRFGVSGATISRILDEKRKSAKVTAAP